MGSRRQPLDQRLSVLLVELDSVLSELQPDRVYVENNTVNLDTCSPEHREVIAIIRALAWKHTESKVIPVSKEQAVIQACLPLGSKKFVQSMVSGFFGGDNYQEDEADALFIAWYAVMYDK